MDAKSILTLSAAIGMMSYNDRLGGVKYKDPNLQGKDRTRNVEKRSKRKRIAASKKKNRK